MTKTFDGSLALELRGVHKTYGGKPAVNGLDLRVPRGQMLCLLGPNGAGKTTTIEMCEGFISPTSGTIRVLGLDPTTQADQVRARIGIMLQGGGSYSGIRVREMLHLAASYNQNPHDPDWLMELLGLEGVARHTYRRLSGGQKQRLSLALAVISRPELVFLDEPTAGMDAQSRLAVWRLIDALKRDGTTIVLTTHLMDEAEALADYIAIIDQGELIAEGTPSELMTRTANPQVTVSTNEAIDVERFARDSGIGLDLVRPLHYRVHAAGTPELLVRLTEALARQGVLAHRIDTAHRNLEDVFLDLTGRELRS
ncbi:ABC transporter ATP-binding protein [Corynebacterium sp. HMSC04H06]|uniref:ABC transporter ATP-binding protein n=1 Tax=Corynebacterium sp. HMSC04H06 TaxID=1581050 RepID=UPI0008A2B003|nr:ABC transporter ATP-binding protein [Corynebacterium sp. HMSC04H06]OFS23169.1 spermidine/putrescine ABC transporter ATP-binding protein [Corynebacterium sp. HMSC04H06]